MLMDNSYQLQEVQKNPQYCNNQQVDTQIFTPPDNLEFMTTKQMTDEQVAASMDTMTQLCEICLEKYSTRREQLECFSISNIVGQYPKEFVESTFYEYCIVD